VNLILAVAILAIVAIALAFGVANIYTDPRNVWLIPTFCVPYENNRLVLLCSPIISFAMVAAGVVMEIVTLLLIIAIFLFASATMERFLKDGELKEIWRKKRNKLAVPIWDRFNF